MFPQVIYLDGQEAKEDADLAGWLRDFLSQPFIYEGVFFDSFRSAVYSLSCIASHIPLAELGAMRGAEARKTVHAYYLNHAIPHFSSWENRLYCGEKRHDLLLAILKAMANQCESAPRYLPELAQYTLRFTLKRPDEEVFPLSTSELEKLISELAEQYLPHTHQATG